MIYKLQRAKGSSFVKDKEGKDTKFYAGRKNRLSTPYDRHGYLTGLTKEQEKYFEKELGLLEGDLSRPFKRDGVKDFYGEWYLEVGNAGVELNDEFAADAVAIAILKQKENVATTMQAMNKAGVEYLLTCEDADAKLVIDERGWKVKAFAHLANMTPEAQRNYLTATGKKITGLSPEAIEKKVGDDAEKSPKQFMAIVSDKDLDLIVFINELIQFGVLHNHGAQIVDGQNGDIVAMRKEDLISKFKEADSQPMYVTYQKELKAKKKAK